MALGDFLRKAADAADDVSKKMSSAVDDVSKKVSSAIDDVSNVASDTAGSVKSTVSKTIDLVTDSASSAYDSMCELAVLKIRDILKGANLQETLDALEKYEKESGKDISSLKEFVTRIKIFSEEDGSK